MTKLRIHRFENEKWGRYHLPWMKKFANYLMHGYDVVENPFDVEVINYNKDGKTFSGRINMQTSIGEFGKTPPLSDVDCVYENLDTGEFAVTSAGKYFTSHVVHYAKSDLCTGIACGHFSQRYMREHLKKNQLLHKLNIVHPWFFGFFQDFDVDHYRSIRDNCSERTDGLFFKGGGWKGASDLAYRNVINILYNDGYLDPNSVRFDLYLTQLAKQGIAVSHYMDLDRFTAANKYPGEMCYRDIEMMAIGVPFIRVEYKSEVMGGFKPDYHYISIPREDAVVAHNKHQHRGVADLIIQKFNEIKNDQGFLDFISTNQRKWYDEYMRWPVSAVKTMQLLKMDIWN